MCGIFGYAGSHQAAPLLLEGLYRLEYRGYDSAGMAVWSEDGGEIHISKTEGRMEKLAKATQEGRALRGTCGVGHTRWATHGRPDARNAHPHASPRNRVVLVHNGIIENHAALREALCRKGYAFASDTDTETAAMLLDSLYGSYAELPLRRRALAAIRAMMAELCGSYALGILFHDQPGVLYAVRKDSPLWIGCGVQGGRFLASDAHALSGAAGEIICLEEKDVACLTGDAHVIYAEGIEEVIRPRMRMAEEAISAQKGNYPHFMLKEMMEQPRAVRDTIAPYLCSRDGRLRVNLRGAGLDESVLRSVKRVRLIGCGSAYRAGLVGRAVIERLAQVPADAELASEWRYREPLVGEDELAVIISQSGETADSLAALRLCREKGMKTLAIVNVPFSSIAREADTALCTQAGPEIAVATTKGYSAQLAALYLLAIALAAARGVIDGAREKALSSALCALPEDIAQALNIGKEICAQAERTALCRGVFFIGRALDHAVCMEGSLKLKEVACIHAEAYPAGELKHGTLSLMEAGVLVIGVGTQTAVLQKTLGNLAEAKSRGAGILGIAAEGMQEMAGAADAAVYVPCKEPLFAASTAVIPLQWLAYAVGCKKGLDVDKPRNLAKSVTVE